MFPSVYRGLVAAVCGVIVCNSYAIDNGSQMNEKFRINYAGYMPQATKLALYINPNVGPINWSVAGTACSGSEDTYVSNDKSSGDSFYQIDFSECVEEGTNLRLVVGSDQSLPFEISSDPYGAMKYEFFDYFKDHEGSATFSNAKNNWQTGLSISFSYVKDAGDNGAYPVNTAEAAWALINMLETYPSINTYYSSNLSGARTVYDQLLILTEQFNHVFDHGGPLAIPKFHTNVNGSWAACSPHTSGTCISEPETKATFSTARTLAAMARLHLDYGSATLANSAYQSAKTALNNALNEPLVCNQEDSFGGEGGMYPDNDVYGLWRDPKQNRDNCVADKNNTQDDEYAALVENYLAALKLGLTGDAAALESQVTNHPRHNEASSYWWGAVATEGSLSLLANESLHGLNLATLKSNILLKADSIQANQALGYPGVTWDPYSDQWNNGDQDDADNNVRWGSHRMALNDARLLMAAAEIQRAANQNVSAASYARGAIQVLDHIAGINAVNLAMFTASGYPKFENAVERTHDGANSGDSWPGKMVLGPNNWTNADDPDMPAFNSQPGLKMFALTGTGWSSREISIDANASLVPVAYFTTEVAPEILALDPIGNVQAPVNVPAAPTLLNAQTAGANSIELSWQDNAGNNDDAEQGFHVYLTTTNAKPAAPVTTVGANSSSYTATGLSAETTYYFWVEAYNAVGTSADASASATTDFQPAFVNLVNNGDFSGGTSGWECAINSGTGNCSVVSGEYVVSISNGGSQSWHIQPRQEAITLNSGTTYTFAFDARAQTSRSAEIKVERSVSPWEDFSQIGGGQSLSTQMQRFVYTFTMPTTLSNARIVMNIGNSNSNLTVDNIWLVQGSVDPCGGSVGCTGEEPLDSYQISVSSGANGSITPSTVTVLEGESQTFSIQANPGYYIEDVVRNGVSLGAVSTVTFDNVTSNQSLSAVFAQEVATNYSITVSAGPNGSVNPGSLVVEEGGSASFSFTPDAGYVVENVVVNGVSQGAISTYSFANVSADQSLSVSFAAQSIVEENDIQVRMRGTAGTERVSLTVGGVVVDTWTLGTALQTYSASTELGGELRVEFTNDASGRDVFVDYVVINGAVLQAEDQDDNTGAWGNSACGGGTLSSWLHCSGSIGFGDIPAGSSSSSSDASSADSSSSSLSSSSSSSVASSSSPTSSSSSIAASSSSSQSSSSSSSIVSSSSSSSSEASSSASGFPCTVANSTLVNSSATAMQGACLRYNHNSGQLRLGTWSASGLVLYDVQNCNGGVVENVEQTLNTWTGVATGANFCEHIIYVKQASNTFQLQFGSW